MKLEKLLAGLEYKVLSGELDVEVNDIQNDSRNVKNGSLFICISGAKFDAHNFIKDVVDKGAKVIIVEKDVNIIDGVTIIKVEDTRFAMANISCAYYDYPARKLKTIGITGTKGKTTTTYMVKAMLEEAGHNVGLIGTIESIFGDGSVIKASNTTPESMLIQEYFDRMVKTGCDTVVMEVSSQGLMLHRTAGIEFDYGIFTNLSEDHIGENEHKDFEDYTRCKSLLFKQCKVGIVNIDDENCENIIKGHTCKIETFGLNNNADFKASDLKLVSGNGMLGIDYKLSGKLNGDIQVDIPGNFSVYNSLTAIAIASHFNISIDVMKDALKKIRVKGRVEIIPISDKFTLMIDYAHNAMSLESILTTLKQYNPKRLVCLFGCGGNRSKTRRYEMGEVSGKLADLTIITSDNPRFEEPQDIIDDIKIGIKKTSGEYIEIIDRKEAIKYCIENAKDGDVIVLAGKGHEDYQEINGVKKHMDERELIEEILKEIE